MRLVRWALTFVVQGLAMLLSLLGVRWLPARPDHASTDGSLRSPSPPPLPRHDAENDAAATQKGGRMFWSLVLLLACLVGGYDIFKMFVAPLEAIIYLSLAFFLMMLRDDFEH